MRISVVSVVMTFSSLKTRVTVAIIIGCIAGVIVGWGAGTAVEQHQQQTIDAQHIYIADAVESAVDLILQLVLKDCASISGLYDHSGPNYTKPRSSLLRGIYVGTNCNKRPERRV